MEQYNYMVFCDFDGTATAWETSEHMLETLMGKEAFDKKMNQLLSGHAGTSEGIPALYHMIPSDSYPRLLDYVKTVKLRSGFVDFLCELKSRNIPIVLISGAVTEMVQGVLNPYRHFFIDMYCCTLDRTGPFLNITSEFDDGVDLLRKERVMERYNYKHSIFIGDSYTDMNAAQKADIVFARDRLDQFLDSKNISHHKFEYFDEIIETFKKENYTNIL